MKLTKRTKKLGLKKKTRNWFICTRKKNFLGKKSQRKYQEETKRCATVDIEGSKAEPRFNGPKKITSYSTLWSKNTERIGK